MIVIISPDKSGRSLIKSGDITTHTFVINRQACRIKNHFSLCVVLITFLNSFNGNNTLILIRADDGNAF